MTWHRTIKWLTILMLALSLVIAGAWVWASSMTMTNQFVQIQTGTEAYVGTIEANTMLEADAEQRGLGEKFWPTGVVAVRVAVNQYSNGRVWVEDRVTLLYHRVDPQTFARFADVPPVDLDMTAVLAMAEDRLGSLDADGQPDIVTRAIRRGIGTHRRLHWHGVAQRVRFYAPRALALTGFLTLAGFTTLFVQRRRRRDRVKSGYCVACGYDLRGLTAAICPECGRDAPSPAPGAGGVAERPGEG